jgi:hypothetical protein
MNINWQRSLWIRVELLTACLVFALGRPAVAQTGSGVGPSAFSGGSGWFSSRLISNPVGFHPIPSVGAFPGSTFRSMRTPNVGVPSPSLAVPGGFSAANPFAAFYGNPTAPGVTGRFEEPLSQISATASAMYAGAGTVSPAAAPAAGGAAAGGGMAGLAVVSLGDLLAAQSLLAESAAIGVAAAPTAVEAAAAPALAGPAINLNVSGAALARPPIRPHAPLKPREDLQQILARSSSLAPTDSIQVLSDGATVFLRGVVANANDRRMAEALLRLSPGVDQVQNELTVGPARP